MFSFIAKRIHAGFMTWNDLSSKKESFVNAVKEAYKKLFPGEDVPE